MADRVVPNPQVGVKETWHDNTDGTWSLVVTTTDAAGLSIVNPVSGLLEKYVSVGDGTYKRLVNSA